MPLIRTAQDLGLLLREARRARGLSQATAAARAGVSRQWLVGVERGKPGAELALVLRLAAVLGLRLGADLPADAQDIDLDQVLERNTRP